MSKNNKLAHLVPTRRGSRSPEQAGPDKQKEAAEGWEHCSFSPTLLYLPRMPGESRKVREPKQTPDLNIYNAYTVETRRCG